MKIHVKLLIVGLLLLPGCQIDRSEEIKACVDSGSDYEVCYCIANNPKNQYYNCYKPSKYSLTLQTI
jgi:hypothetical protein